MVAAFRPSSTTISPRPRRLIRPSVEALEERAVPAGSIVATFDGLTAPVISVTLPRPASSGTQLATFMLKSSPDIPALFRDNATGKHLKDVAITFTGFGNTVAAPITLSDAVIASFRTVNAPGGIPTYTITVAGRSTPAGSITATFDGQSGPVVDVTLTQPPPNGALKVGLTLVTSPLAPVLSRDAVRGNSLQKVQIAFIRDGNNSTDAITLVHAVVSSFQLKNGTSGASTYTITLLGQAAPPLPTTATFDGASVPVLDVVPSPPSSGMQDVTFTLGLSAADLPLIRDAILGRPVKTVVIVRDDGNGGPATTALTDVFLTSFQLVSTPSGRISLVLKMAGRV